MAYTPYNQALPDTTLYERLQGNYTPIRGRENPYDSSLFNTEYYKDPFGYTKKKLGFGPTLDDTLGNKASAVNLGGLFTPQASSGGDSGNQENQRNYYQDLEDRYTALNISEDGMSPEEARAAAQASVFKEQSMRNQGISDFLTDFSKIGIAGLFSSLIGGTPTPAGTGTPAPVVTASDTIARATREAEARAIAERQAAAQAEAARQAAAAQAAADAARNVQPVSTYTPTGNASDWSPVDSSGNISWSGQTYSPSAYSSLSDAFG